MELSWSLLPDHLTWYTLLIEGARTLLILYSIYILIYIGNLWKGRESKSATTVIVGLLGILIYLVWAVIHNGLAIFDLDEFLRFVVLDAAIYLLLKGTKVLAQFEAECNQREGTCPVCGHNREL